MGAQRRMAGAEARLDGRRRSMKPQDAASRFRAEMELRSQVTSVESEMAQVGARVKIIDETLNGQLALHQPRGTQAAIDEYLAWLDRVEGLGLAFVNANIVTQRLRLFYQDTARTRGALPDPAPRMKEVKNLLETVRHTEQANLLLLRARRHALLSDIQSLARERKSENGSARGTGGKTAGAPAPVVVALAVAALLLGIVLIDSFQPEIVRFVRTTAGLSAPPPSQP